MNESKIPNEIIQINDLKEFHDIESCIYFLFYDNSLVYIGQTTHLSARIRNHHKNKKFNRVFYKKIRGSMMDALETALIRYFKPDLNILKKKELTDKDLFLLENYCDLIPSI